MKKSAEIDGATYEVEGRLAGACQVEMRQVRARRHDRTKHAVRVVPVLQREHDGERGQRLQADQHARHRERGQLPQAHRVQQHKRLQRL